MSQATRDPRAKTATAASTLTAGGLVIALTHAVAPEASGEVVGGVTLAAGVIGNAAGAAARDMLHDQGEGLTGWRRALVVFFAKLLG